MQFAFTEEQDLLRREAREVLANGGWGREELDERERALRAMKALGASIRPVAAPAWLKVVCSRPLTGSISSGNASMYVSFLPSGGEVSHKFADDGMGGYLYVIGGEVTVNGEALQTGDAAKIGGEPEIDVTATADTELILTEVDLTWSPR